MLSSSLLSLLERLRGWRLSAVLAIGTVIGALVIVSLMDLLFHHEITADYLVTGLVAAGVVAPPSLALLNHLLHELFRRDQALLAGSMDRIERRLAVAVDVARLVSWELDFKHDRLLFDRKQLALLGLDPDADLSSLARWIAHVHPDDRQEFLERARRATLIGESPFDFEYRLVDTAGRAHWIHTRARVIERDAAGEALVAVGASMNVSTRKHAEEALRTSETRSRELAAMLRLMCDNVPDMIWAKDLERRYLFANKALCRRLLNATDTAEPVGRTEACFNDRERARHPDDPDWQTFGIDAPDTDSDTLALGRPTVFEISGTVQGRPLVLEVHQAPFLDDTGKAIGTVGSARDITERKRAEEQLHLAASVFTHAREGIMITAPDGTIIDVNEAFTRITGYPRAEVLGRNPRFLNSGRQDPAFFAAMWQELIATGRWSGEVWNRRRSGEVYAVMQTISAVPDTAGHTRQYVALFADITRVKEQEIQLERIAHYDALTGLPNRLLLGDRLRQAIVQADRHQKLLAVAYLDLDGFKAVNDLHGHDVGDHLLVALATRMRDTLREADTFARLGGDEFVAVLPDLADIAGSLPFVARLLAAAADPVEIDDRMLQVSASLGVTFYPQGEEVDADHLLRQADQAMYEAKVAGKNRYHIFDADRDRSVRGNQESLERIRQALAGREFVLHYQPKVNLVTGAVLGVEALIRWRFPGQGLLPPIDFLPIVEGHPLAVEIGEWVLAAALEDLAGWRAAGLPLTVSVNVSPSHLQQKDFVDRLRAILATQPTLGPDSLCLEILETSAFEDLAHISAVVQSCCDFGVQHALDDFGTAYSSLTCLKRLPVSEIKIDQSFVRDMLEDHDARAIVAGVLGLARAFDRTVVAEGVENLEQALALVELDCTLAQGFGIAEPMPAVEIESWVHAWPAHWMRREIAGRRATPAHAVH